MDIKFLKCLLNIEDQFIKNIMNFTDEFSNMELFSFVG